jgi:hypothetical protein
MTFNYCTFDPLSEYVCRYPEGFSVGAEDLVAEHIPTTDAGYQEWLSAHPEGAPLYSAPGQPWDPSLLPPEPTFKDKLATLGITIEDLKAELGIV